MTNKPTKSKRPLRDTRLFCRVDDRLHQAVERYAIEHGYTLSSAVYRILLDWEKKERRRVARTECHSSR